MSSQTKKEGFTFGNVILLLAGVANLGVMTATLHAIASGPDFPMTITVQKTALDHGLAYVWDTDGNAFRLCPRKSAAVSELGKLVDGHRYRVMLLEKPRGMDSTVSSITEIVSEEL